MGNASILVLAEMADGAPAPLAFEVLGLARQMADATGADVRAVVLGQGAAAAGEKLVASGADKVHVADRPEFADYEPDIWLGTLAGLARAEPATSVLMGHTNLGADLAPRLAFRLGGAVATNCEAVKHDGGKLLVTRPCYGNKARSTLWLKAPPAVVTVRAKSQTPPEPDARRRGDIVELAPSTDPPAKRSHVVARANTATEGPQLETAKIVIGGGRGLGGPEGFRLLDSLAETVGGVVGASRVACDLGWCPLSMQIGLTGRTIAPELYIAVGISGASQHMAGCSGTKAIVAINSDPQAPIFEDATLGVVGDYKELLPRLIDEIRRLKAGAARVEA